MLLHQNKMLYGFHLPLKTMEVTHPMSGTSNLETILYMMKPESTGTISWPVPTPPGTPQTPPSATTTPWTWSNLISTCWWSNLCTAIWKRALWIPLFSFKMQATLVMYVLMHLKTFMYTSCTNSNCSGTIGWMLYSEHSRTVWVRY